MYTVKRAIILAAGKGERLRPVTLETPKPLVKIKEKPIIETIIEKLIENEITEIYITVGYKKKKFKYLEKKYNNITLLENPYYSSTNNISSLYIARNFIKDSIIIEGDLIINNKNILRKNFEKSGYNAILSNNITSEWGLKVENNTILDYDKLGGKFNYQLVGISRWNEKDAEKLKEHLVIEFEKNKKSDIYWDEIALDLFKKEYNLGILKINSKDVKEIDTLKELVEIDKSYEKYLL